MPFKEKPDGQTHYYNDGCGEPDHNHINSVIEVESWYDSFIEREQRKPDKEDIIAFFTYHNGQVRKDAIKEIKKCQNVMEKTILLAKELRAAGVNYRLGLREDLEKLQKELETLKESKAK